MNTTIDETTPTNTEPTQSTMTLSTPTNVRITQQPMKYPKIFGEHDDKTHMFCIDYNALKVSYHRKLPETTWTKNSPVCVDKLKLLYYGTDPVYVTRSLKDCALLQYLAYIVFKYGLVDARIRKSKELNDPDFKIMDDNTDIIYQINTAVEIYPVIYGNLAHIFHLLCQIVEGHDGDIPMHVMQCYNISRIYGLMQTRDCAGDDVFHTVIRHERATCDCVLNDPTTCIHKVTIDKERYPATFATTNHFGKIWHAFNMMFVNPKTEKARLGIFKHLPGKQPTK